MSTLPENDPYAAVIADIDEQIERLQAMKENLSSLRAGRIGAVAETGTKPQASASFSHDAFFGMTAAEASRKYLTAIKRTAPVKTIADALIAGGWKSASKNVTENLRTILSRNAAFVVINGEFGLAEWYPGRKAAAKPKTAPQTFAEFADQQLAGDEELDPEAPMGEEAVIRPE